MRKMRCSKCGTENRDGAKFCKDCAAPLLRKCANCGATIQPESKFCDECGVPVPAAALKSQVQTEQAAGVRVLPEETVANAAEGERKTVTMLFADIKGSMELIEDLDPEEARAIVDPALELMMVAVQRYGG